MSNKFYAYKDETLDALCWRVTGKTAGLCEQTLALNPGLAKFDCFLPVGTVVTLPEKSANTTLPLIQLWD